MDYTPLDGGGLEARKVTDGGTVVFRAENIRKTRTGVHAKMTLALNGTPLSVDNFNVERDAERTKFVNKFYSRKKKIGTLPNFYAKDELELDLMVWCEGDANHAGLWQAWLGELSGQDIEGDENPSAPPWAVPGLVMEGATAIWAGDAGANKSTLLRLTAQCLRYGVTGIIPIKKQAMVVWVNAEEPPAEHSRQVGNTNQAIGLPRDYDMFTVDARGLSIDDLAPRLEQAVKYSAAEHVFIDSLSRLAHGMNLNENATATLLIDSVAALGTSVTWIGHTGHENRERLGGSRHFENAGRVMVLVKSRMSAGGPTPELKRGVRATVYKANGAIPTEPMHWTLNYHRQHGLIEVGMATEDDWPVLFCGARSGNGDCGRRTWDGVTRYGVRCSRHRGDEEGA